MEERHPDTLMCQAETREDCNQDSHWVPGEERCRVCGKKVKVQIQKNTGLCSQKCGKCDCGTIDGGHPGDCAIFGGKK